MRILEKAGIDPEKVPGKGKRMIRKKTFHSLRHTLTSQLANAGVSKEIRMKILGHTSEGSHDQYTHLEFDALKKAIDSA